MGHNLHERSLIRLFLAAGQQLPVVGGIFLLLHVFSGECHSQAAVEEWELSRCVDDVYKVRPTKCIHQTQSSLHLLRQFSSLVSVCTPAQPPEPTH